MLPVIYSFSFSSPAEKALLYAVAFVFAAWSGFRGATGANASRLKRAAIFGAAGVVVAFIALTIFRSVAPTTDVPIHTYGVLVGSGFITAVTVASWLAQREWPGDLGLRRRDQLFDMAFYVFIGAMVGSRVLFIIVNWKDYAANPLKVFSLGGGLVFYGGLIGASITAFFWAKKNDIEFLRLADVAMPTVALGQALGRLGCFAAGCCWGDITGPNAKTAVHFPGTNAMDLFGGKNSPPSLAYGSQLDDQRYVVEATGKVTHDAVAGSIQIAKWVGDHHHSLPVHPTQLYESFGHVLLFSGLLLARNYRRFHGQIFALYLMCYAVLRSTVEVFRGDVERGTLNGLLNYLGLQSLAERVPLEAWYNISVSQFISMCLFSLGAWVWASRSKDARRLPQLVVTTA